MLVPVKEVVEMEVKEVQEVAQKKKADHLKEHIDKSIWLKLTKKSMKALKRMKRMEII